MSVQRYKVGYYTDEWGMSSNTPCLLRDDNGYAVKFDDYALLKKQRDELLAELKSISKITGDAGFNIGGPLEHCPGEIDHDEAKRLLILACEYLKDTSKAAHRAIASVKENSDEREQAHAGTVVS